MIRIWNYATDRYGYAQCIPRRIRRQRSPEKIVKAWSLNDLSALLSASREMPGTLRCGIPANVFMTAWIWVGYETGIRPGDLRELRWENVDLANRTILIVQHKTRKVHAASFGEDAAAWLQRLQAFGNELVFPLCKWGVRRWEGFLYARAARFGFSRLKGQGIGTLRKSHATQIYLLHGLAAAADSLGHRGSTRTAGAHYVDSRQQRGLVPPRPRLVDCAAG